VVAPAKLTTLFVDAGTDILQMLGGDVTAGATWFQVHYEPILA
jgi:hypothetical protein